MRSGVVVFGCLLAVTSAAADSVPRSQRVLEVGIHEGVPWPLINAPIDGPLPDAPRSTEPAPPPATRAGVRVLGVVDQIRTTMVDTKYQASTRVNAKDGLYYWDCSGMASWILRRAAPVAQRALASDRPVARDFAAAIERAPIKRAKAGWQRIANIADVRPGDVFAWRRPRGMPSKNTGHVGFVVGTPLPVPEIPGAWAIPIADSTSSYHQHDTRGANDDGGFGIGTLTFLTDAAGNVTSYGWGGTHSEWYIVTRVVFGRVTQ